MGRLKLSNETKTSLIALTLIAITALANIGPYVIGALVLFGIISSYYGPNAWFGGAKTFGYLAGVFFAGYGIAASLGYTTVATILFWAGVACAFGGLGLA